MSMCTQFIKIVLVIIVILTTLDIYPRNEREYQDEGKINLQKGNYQRAASCFLKSIQKNPTNTKYYDKFIVALMKGYEYERAQHLLKTLLREYPVEHTIYLNYGKVLQWQGEYLQAINYFEKAQSLNQNQNYHQLIGKCYQELSMYKQAEYWYRKNLQQNQRQGISHNLVALNLFYQQKYEQGERYMRKAIELSPKDSVLYSNLGQVLRQQRKYEESDKYYRVALELNSNDADIYEGISQLLRQQGKYRQLIAIHEGQIEVVQGKILTLQNKDKKINKKVNKDWLKLYNNSLAYHYSEIGATLYLQQRYQLCQEYMLKAIAIDSQNEQYLTQIVKSYLKRKQYELAKQYAIHVYSQNDKDSAYELLGMIQEDRGNLEYALYYYLKAIKQFEYGVYYSHSAMVLVKMGRCQQAIWHFQAAIAQQYGEDLLQQQYFHHYSEFSECIRQIIHNGNGQVKHMNNSKILQHIGDKLQHNSYRQAASYYFQRVKQQYHKINDEMLSSKYKREESGQKEDQDDPREDIYNEEL